MSTDPRNAPIRLPSPAATAAYTVPPAAAAGAPPPALIPPLALEQALGAPPDDAFPPDPIPRIIPGGGITILGGAPGAGKTALVTGWACAWRDGRPIFGHAVQQPQRVAYITADRSWTQSARLWFDAAGFPEILHYSLQDDRAFIKGRLRDKDKLVTGIFAHCLQQLAIACPGGRLPFGLLVIVDPISLFLGGNLNDYFACAIACSEIRELCLRYGITVLGLAHAAKQKGASKDRYSRLQDRIAGSTAIAGYSDTQIYLASPDEAEEDHYLCEWSPHHAPTETFFLDRGDDGLFVPIRGATEILNLTRMETQLLPLISAQLTMSTADIVSLGATQLKQGRRSVERLLKGLLRRGQIEKPVRGQYRRVIVQ
jgi:hypothetical protein